MENKIEKRSKRKKTEKESPVQTRHTKRKYILIIFF